MNAASVRTQRETLAVEPDLNQQKKEVHLASRTGLGSLLIYRKIQDEKGNVCAGCLCVCAGNNKCT